MNKNKAFGSTAIARICHVTPPTVGRWIAEGKLPCFTTGGGHRRVWARDLMDFLQRHNLPVPASLESSFVLRALIVDDEALVRKAVRRMIAALDSSIEIHDAADGFEAGHAVATVAPHLVVLDVGLPGIDGIRVCELIRRTAGLRHTKILVISGRDARRTERLCLDAGADAFLAKPFDVEELKRRVEELLGPVRATREGAR